MSWREIVVEQMRLEYEGLFDAREMHHVIDFYFREKGYDKRETKNYEKDTPEGKFIEMELTPWKKVTDYIRNIVKLRILIDNMTDVEVEKDNAKIKLNRGHIKIVIDSFLDYDYDDRWDAKPIQVFLRSLFDKYFFYPYWNKYKGVLLEDTTQVHNMLKSYFNVYRTFR